jgi:hypothetical protein
MVVSEESGFAYCIREAFYEDGGVWSRARILAQRSIAYKA